MAIEDWMPNLAALMAAVDGIEAVYFPHDSDAKAGLPGTLQVFPCLVILPDNGTQGFGGSKIALHRVQMTIYMPEGLALNESYSQTIKFIKLIRNKLAANQKLGLPNQVNHCGPDSSASNFYEGPGSVKYGDKPQTGIIFRIEVKEHESFTVSD